MKTLLLGAAIAVAFGGMASAQTMTFPQGALKDGRIDLESPQGVMMANRKVQCSVIDEQPVTYYWHGQAYSRRMGERDVHLFDVEGMNIRQCGTVNDADRGMGYKLVSREILLYKDKDTGEVLKTWTNPWTDEELEVMHVANDPVNFTSYMMGRDGSPGAFRGDIYGNHFQMNSTFPLWYPNPLASDYQPEIGGTYHATEMFNFLGRVDELTDPSTHTAPIAVGWARMSDWLPWMKMNGREGIIYMHTAGLKLDSFDDLSDTMKAEIDMHYPDYVAPPPVSDPRDNMTSWKYYKAVREGEETLPDRG
ncbi:DUF1838 family protein [Algimonas porphyrae]|uniref:DUF1838 domain-containing protein n=1 Tax=Algimonas porphyrae TaxID=1128113 RepID=A0ABQ5UWB8_9PROT|nr:DUF1838 family protein [Algimonas porphyrae]GLQ19579.1 hypothetical protein GCM10007854_05340 [Algimonas porphyrae]